MTDRLANMLGALSLRISDEIRDATEGAGHGGGGAAACLVLLNSLGGTNISIIAESLRMSHSGAVRLVDRLEAEGLVKRRSGIDKRSVSLHLTSKGKRRVRAINDARARAIEAHTGHLSKRDRNDLTRLLETMLEKAIVDRSQIWQTCRLCDVPDCVTPKCPVLEASQQIVH
jgi:DNA-binding MarR family transcriptional regulator